MRVEVVCVICQSLLKDVSFHSKTVAKYLLSMCNPGFNPQHLKKKKERREGGIKEENNRGGKFTYDIF
jgi:hypothetical protein